MKWSSLLCAAVLVLAATPAQPASINVGTHYLLPDTPGQRIPIYVHGTEMAAGMNFNIQVANGGPELEGIVLPPDGGIDGPEIAHVDLVGNEAESTTTVFGSLPYWVGDIGHLPQISIHTIVLQEQYAEVQVEGLLATVTLDTIGFCAGTWPLFMERTHNGPTELLGNAAGGLPLFIPLQVTEGTIAITSTASAVVAGDFAAGTLENWSVAGQGTAAAEEYPPGSGNYVAALTAGSEVRLSQLVDTPDRGYLASFDYAFQSAGTLEVLLDWQPIALIETTGPRELRLERLQIDDPALMDLGGAELAFRFNGPTGAKLMLDNIGVRGVPEPGTIALLLSLLAAVPWLAGRRAGQPRIGSGRRAVGR